MTIYSFWLFDRHCNCIYTKEWHDRNYKEPRTISASSASEFVKPAPPNKHGLDEHAKLIFGVVYSLRNMMRKLTDEDGFVSFKTNNYRLHYFETISNIRFVMITDDKIENMQPVLHQIYASLFVEFVMKNPLSPADFKPGQTVNNELFVLGLDAFVSSLPGFD